MSIDNRDKGKRVSEETLASYLDGSLEPEDRAEVEAVLADDDRALKELASLRMLLTSIEEEPEPAPKFAKVHARNLRRTGFVRKETVEPGFMQKLVALFAPIPVKFATVAVSAALILVVMQVSDFGNAPNEDPGTRIRGEQTAGLSLVESDVIVKPGARVALAWHGIDDAESYVIRIYDETGTVIWHGSSDQPAIIVPADVLSAISGLTSLNWQVEAVRPFGQSIRSDLGTIAID